MSIAKAEAGGSAGKVAMATAIGNASVSAEFTLETAVASYAVQSGLTLGEERELRSATRTGSMGFGKLQEFLDDPEVEEIWLNRPSEVFYAKSGVVERRFMALSAEEISSIIERMLRSSGRRLDRATPFVDAALPDGSRLHVVIPDIAKRHWSVNIRKFPQQVWSLKDLADKAVVSPGQLEVLRQAVGRGHNILVSGATQAGKTTMLCALINESEPATRLVTVEETFEIRSVKHDWVALQTRQPNLEGRGEVTLRRLVKESLRMRPGLLVVGEVREAESLDLLIAMNSGIPGMCTIHANSAQQAITKLCTLPLLAGANISPEFVKQSVAGSIDFVVHCEMLTNGTRRVAEIARVVSNSVQGVGLQLGVELLEC